ncbi:MAG: alpha/beta hydrolase, partial [Candidatus Nanopelagicales bacterium]
VVGWSFGTDVILRNPTDLNVSGVILLSPPLRFTKEDELARWRDFAKPIWALVPEFDDYLTPDQAKLRFLSVPNLKQVNAKAARHLWIGENQVRFVLNHIVKIITGNENPLPEEFSGLMTRHNDLNRD